MTESQQSQRGWFSSWREHRRARRQQALESQMFEREKAGEHGGLYGSSSTYPHAGRLFYGTGGSAAATAAVAAAATAAAADADAQR